MLGAASWEGRGEQQASRVAAGGSRAGYAEPRSLSIGIQPNHQVIRGREAVPRFPCARPPKLAVKQGREPCTARLAGRGRGKRDRDGPLVGRR